MHVASGSGTVIRLPGARARSANPPINVLSGYKTPCRPQPCCCKRLSADPIASSRARRGRCCHRLSARLVSHAIRPITGFSKQRPTLTLEITTHTLNACGTAFQDTTSALRPPLSLVRQTLAEHPASTRSPYDTHASCMQVQCIGENIPLNLVLQLPP